MEPSQIAELVELIGVPGAVLLSAVAMFYTRKKTAPEAMCVEHKILIEALTNNVERLERATEKQSEQLQRLDRNVARLCEKFNVDSDFPQPRHQR